MLYVILAVIGVGMGGWMWALCRIAGQSDQLQEAILRGRNGSRKSPSGVGIENDFPGPLPVLSVETRRQHPESVSCPEGARS